MDIRNISIKKISLLIVIGLIIGLLPIGVLAGEFKIGDLKDFENISKWALEDVKEAGSLGFLEDNEKLQAKEPIKRGEFIRLLVLALGLDEANIEEEIFQDVKKDNPYFKFINTSYESKIVLGSNGKFNPDGNITREEMAAIIDRALKLENKGPVGELKDGDRISNWAKEPINRIISNGIITGDKNTFNPRGLVTKEMAIVISMRTKKYGSPSIIKEEIKGGEKGVSLGAEIDQLVAKLKTSVTNPKIGTLAGDWTVFGIARSGKNQDDSYYAKYYDNVRNELKEKAGILHKVKYSEYSRLVLAVNAIGKDGRNVDGYNLIEPLADFDTLIKQGLNGPVFALIAFDSMEYKIPNMPNIKNLTTREKLVDYILARELPGGGWALKGDELDLDMTSMAMQALSNYQDDLRVKTSLDKAINLLSEKQDSRAGFKSLGGGTCESLSQAIIGLSSMGINILEDERFIKSDRTLLDALMEFKNSDGMFKHLKSEENSDPMASDQALMALVGLDKLLKGQGKLYKIK